MEIAGQNGGVYDEDEALRRLYDVFGASCTLENIAHAYCKANRNIDLAGEILYDMKEGSSTSGNQSCNSDAKVEVSSESSDGRSFESSFNGRKGFKPKIRPVSAGTVSSVIGKSYVKPAPSVNGFNGTTKPPKLDARTMPVTGIWREKSKPKADSSKRDQLQEDMEEFLFKMLGDGFKLERNVIREVLETCGYDMKKSLENLLDRSAMALDKRPADVRDVPGKVADMKRKSEAPGFEKQSNDLNCTRGNGNIDSVKEAEVHQRQKERHDIQKEVWSNLFSYREYVEKPPKRYVRRENTNLPYGDGHVVFEPPKDSAEEYKINMDFRRRDNEDDAEDEADYQCVRKAVKEYRVTMKEYYKAAVEAFAKGEQIKAEKLLEKGQFYKNKAREADEESSKMILQTRDSEPPLELDLHEHDPKEAVRLLKCHLSSLSGFSSFDHLKIIFDANDQANKKRSCRRLVLKLLEQESIKWVEGETAGTILIRLDNIDRKQLSFFKA
ncbi:putative nuclear RNA export factor SDE5 [Vicia villosa]|uniref:putative nuclear RNA export factor SDE5 n=1 Tax=Vicia villosa TaxID=3911 RepID=UPI00273B661E|nr:putative nuclear RNA export factor SDE5 [Vicia villosa]XP_058750718.1 putative nuclear RNA export factor SDE5 [Vicia villosa]